MSHKQQDASAMTAEAQRELGMSNAQMARVLRINDRSYRRLLVGNRGATGTVSRVVEALLAGWRPADFSTNRADENDPRTETSRPRSGASRRHRKNL